MTNTNIRGRHRAPARTPIAALSQAASSQANRRGALVTASSGLIITMVATTASAAPQTTVEAAPQAADTTITNEALTVLSVAPTVTVAEDATFEVDAVSADSEPAPVVRTTTTSRSTTRTATATTTTAATDSSSAVSSAQATASSVPDSAIGNSVVAIAMQYLGTPYVYGGSTPSGFDCSGFTQYVYAQLGYSIGRTTSEQRYAGTVVSYADAQPGDLVWWSGHVSIYVGNGMKISANSPGNPLSVSPIYRSNPTFIRIG